MKTFRRTWRHEIIIEAETKDQARQIWEDINLGDLNRELEDGEILSHGFVENVSFEDDEYNEERP